MTLRPMQSFALAAALCAPAFAAEPAAPTAPAAKNPGAATMSEQQQTLYGIGVWLSQQVSVFHLTSGELKTVETGLRDGVLGKKLQIDPALMITRLKAFAQQRATAAAAKEKAGAKAVLDKAAKEPGAKTLPSGSVYLTVKEGSGDSPKADDSAKFNMRGTADGKVFEDTFERKQPAEATPAETGIDCLKEALELMKPGESVKLTCPSSAAFGDAGHPPQIPGGAAIVFDVELLSVTKGISADDQKKALETAAKEPGAKKYPSGLVVKITKEGKGASPKETDTVKVNYRGTLVNGKEFDANKGIEFGLKQVIPCWTEGLQKLKVGGSAVLTCPASIAYGERGQSGIPAGSTLIFEVDLLDIVKK